MASHSQLIRNKSRLEFRAFYFSSLNSKGGTGPLWEQSEAAERDECMSEN